jgi:hypothetical protein
MLVGDVDRLEALPLDLLPLIIPLKVGILIVVNIAGVMVFALHVDLNLMAISPDAILVVLQGRLHVDADADVHLVIDYEGKVDVVDVFEFQLVQPIELLQIFTVILLKQELLDVFV